MRTDTSWTVSIGGGAAGHRACNCSGFGTRGIAKGEKGFALAPKPCKGAEPISPQAAFWQD